MHKLNRNIENFMKSKLTNDEKIQLCALISKRFKRIPLKKYVNPFEYHMDASDLIKSIRYETDKIRHNRKREEIIEHNLNLMYKIMLLDMK